MSLPNTPESPTSKAVYPLQLIRHLWSINRALTFVAVLNLVVLLGTLVGMLIDDRVITGMPAWFKPAKFAISISIYSMTFVWLLGHIKLVPRLAQVIANVTALSFVVEIGIIVVQAARGTTSHFNNSTPLDETLFTIMGLFIVLVWLGNLLTGIILVWEKPEEPAFAMGLRLGLWLTLVGSSVGILMVLPTRDQIIAMRSGETVEILGAHSVGAPDGGPGLPFVGWNQYAGDLRPPHFLGLHALQVMPFIGWLISRQRNIGRRRQKSLVFAIGLAYLSVILVLLSQALRGQSVIAPDWITLTALGTVFGVLALAILRILSGPDES